MTYLEQLQKEIAEWANHNFPERTPRDRLTETTDGIGRLAEQALETVVPILHMIRQVKKVNCGDREQNEVKMQEALGNITFFLIDFCHLNGWSYQEILEQIWSEVKERDWIEDPINGLKKYKGQNGKP